MKTSKVLTIATAAALIMGFTSCNKETGVNVSTEGFKVTLSLKSPSTKLDGDVATSGTEVDILNGFVCVVSAGDVITEVYTIGSAATAGYHINAEEFKTSGFTFLSVPGASTDVYFIANKGTLAAVPGKGGLMANYLKSEMIVEDQQDYEEVTAMGSAKILGTGDSRAAAIALETEVSRIQITDIEFDPTITDGTVVGIFINHHYQRMELDGDTGANSLMGSTVDADFVPSSTNTLFPTTLDGVVYDLINKPIASTVAPDNGVWGYNLFTSPTPQIVIKLSGVTANDHTYEDDLFVTINGFNEDKSGTSTAVTTIAGGMIYTISSGTLVIKPEHLGDTPGTKPMSVNVTVETVEWKETSVTPNLP
jgi:hypothetical protein